MLKKSILTPVLSGVLAVTVVGSGAYYFVNQKNADKDDESSSQSEKADKDNKKKGGDSDVSISVDDAELQTGLDKAVDKIDEVKSGVSDQVDTVTKAMTGDLDFSYNASLTVTPGEVLTSQAEIGDIKAITLNATAKQKGDASQFTLAGLYDGKTLATANIIGDRNSGNVYAQVPELSSTYVSVSAEQLKAQLEKAVQAPATAYAQKAANAVSDGETTAAETAKTPDFNELIAALDTIDAEALEKDIQEYAQLIADNFPEGKDAEATKGTVDGISYELTTKTYDVTQGDTMKIAKAVLEKAKEDTVVKDFLDNETIKEFTQTGGSADYVSAIDQMLAELDSASADESAVVLSFDVMFDADGNFGGFKMDMDGQGIYAVVANVGSDLVVDVKFDGGDDAQIVAAGAIKNDNDTLNGSIKLDYSSKNDDKGNVSMVYTLTDVKTTDDVMTGTVSFDATVDGKTVGVAFTSNSTADKTDLLFTTKMDGKSIFDIAFTLEQTDASDIDVPTDAIAIDLETGDGVDKYTATLDIEGFQAHLKEVLGEDLYNSIIGTGEKAIEDVQTVTDTTTPQDDTLKKAE